MRGFGGVERRKRAAQTELFRVARIDAGYKGTDQFFQQLITEFAPREMGYGLVSRGCFRRWVRSADGVSNNIEFGSDAEKWAEEKCWRIQGRRCEFAILKEVARKLCRGELELRFEPELARELPQIIGERKTLRSEFKEETAARYGTDHSACAVRGLEEMRVNATLSKRVSAG